MSQINQTNMQQPIGWTNPPPSKTSSETIGADILNMYLSALVKRKGTTLPSDIQDGEIWQHQVSDTDSEFYLWRTADGANFGTHILTQTATNEELDKENPTEAELVALANKIANARQIVERFDNVLQSLDGKFDKSGGVTTGELGYNGGTLVAPRPKDGTTDIGSWVSINATPYTLPTGGTWAVFIFTYNTAGAVATGGGSVGLYAGGTVFNQASGYLNKGFAWRIM